MVFITLCVKAELENVAKVEFPEQWSLIVQQTNGEDQREVIVDPSNEEEIHGSRGHCNFKLKWPGAKKESTLNVHAVKGGQPYLSDDKVDEFVKVISFECRGLEPVDWNFKDGSFKVTSTGGKVFEDASFVEGDWYDYDDDNDLSVGVSNIEFKFERS